MLIRFRLAVNGLGLVISTVQIYGYEEDVLVLIGKEKVIQPLCRPGESLSIPGS